MTPQEILEHARWLLCAQSAKQVSWSDEPSYATSDGMGTWWYEDEYGDHYCLTDLAKAAMQRKLFVTFRSLCMKVDPFVAGPHKNQDITTFGQHALSSEFEDWLTGAGWAASCCPTLVSGVAFDPDRNSWWAVCRGPEYIWIQDTVTQRLGRDLEEILTYQLFAADWPPFFHSRYFLTRWYLQMGGGLSRLPETEETAPLPGPDPVPDLVVPAPTVVRKVPSPLELRRRRQIEILKAELDR